MNIVVITTGLNVGGAETLLLHLVKEWLSRNTSITVLSLSGKCHLDDAFMLTGVEVKNYNLKSFSNIIPGLYKLCKDLKQINPEIVQTWMPHADLIGGICARIFTSAQVFWGCHHADISLRSLKWSTLTTVRINALLSYFVPDNIITVSEHVKTQYSDYGFDKRKINVIENGTDCSYFKKRKNARKKLVDELKISANLKMIGFVGRYSFEKRPEDFLKLATLIDKEIGTCHFLMVGDGHDEKNTELADLLVTHGVASKISLLGIRDDVPSILSSLDLLISTSVTEASPMVLIESLACGCPCISSNNEGAKSVGGSFIKYVEVGDIEAFYRETKILLFQDDSARIIFEKKSSEYIVANYSVGNTAARYLNLYIDNVAN
ncbi:glycosyltransferase [Amylibacter sp.]|nr:glycosyltransferase [Amylibacter sp.]